MYILTPQKAYKISEKDFKAKSITGDQKGHFIILRVNSIERYKIPSLYTPNSMVLKQLKQD